MSNFLRNTDNKKAAAAVFILTACLLSISSYAETDLSDGPLASGVGSSVQVKPNIFFILDDSGSMNNDYMPDAVDNDEVGYRSHICNTIYYNPAVTYIVPKDSNGVDLHSISPATPATYPAACSNGYSTSSCSTNLGNRYYWDYVGTSSNLAWPTSGGNDCTLGSSIDITTSSGVCSNGSSLSAATYPNPTSANCVTAYGAGSTLVWKRITLTSASAGAQNYANWYSYYRTRLMMMKAAAGRAFQDISDGYRVGFMTIHPGTFDQSDGSASGSVNSSKFLKIDDFDASQKTAWYNKLYSQTASDSTPLRSALSVAGRYYAGKNNEINNGMVPTAADDPVQYSCQQNFTILTTDGYWNGGSGRRLDGTSQLGNQDGVLSELDAYNPSGQKFAVSPRPIFDGSLQLYVWNTATNAYQYASCTTPATQQKTVQWQSRTVQAQQRTSDLQERSASLQERTSYLQARVLTLVARTSTLQTRTSTNSGTTWSGWTNTGSCAPDTTNPSLRECQYTTWTSWSSVGSCDAEAQDTSGTWSVGTARQCAYAVTTDWDTVNSCDIVARDTSDPYNVATARDCQYTPWTTWSNAGSCDAQAQDTSGTWSVSVARECQYDAWSAWSNVGSCTAISKDTSDPYNIGTARECQYTIWSGWSNVASCTPLAQDTSSPHSVGNAVGCQNVYGAWTNTSGSCTPSATLECQSVDVTAWANVASCTPVGVNGSGQEVLCQNVASTSGRRLQYKTTRTATTYPGPGQTGTSLSTTTTTDSNWSNYNTVCYPLGLQPAFPSTTITAGPPSPPTGCTSGVQEWPCEISSTSGGSSNSLADVAQHYYKTDLRTSALGNCTGALTGISVCDNNVPKTGSGPEDDKANWQHMTTFTMGLGLSGQLPFSATYKTDTSGTFADLRSGNQNWPTPIADSATAIDDLWHAAVDGRGQYFGANNPDSIVAGLTTALAGVQARIGSAAAAATSNLEPVAGDNFIYIPKYVTVDWTGELEARQIDPNTGTVSAIVDWSARDKLDARTFSYTNASTTPATVTSCDTRTIKLFRNGATNNLVDFKWSTDSCGMGNLPVGSPQTTLNAGEQAYFNTITGLSQYPDMTTGSSGTANQRSTAAGANLVNFLRGHRAKEGFVANDINKLYRTREHVLGDVINSRPVGVKVPFTEYDDTGYAAFKTANASRTGTLYVAANDGMLHAFRAADGEETWAFIPTMVLPNLYKLASENYSSHHTYFVDGAPVASDVYDTATSSWKTLMVGGLNKGGKGYYALDVTDPATPKALWEFKYSSVCYDGSAGTAGTDCNLGYTYGNPIIGKLADGRWVVFVTSGHNNVSSTAGDGQGFLYVLNAMTGQIIYKIGTGEGDATIPSGLNRITAWIDNPVRNNTVLRIYGVDLLGNIWRFDVNDTLGSGGREASKVAQVVDGAGNPQPITTRPILSENENGEPVIFVATGRYLGATDLSNTQTQTVWSIRDPMTSTFTGLRSTLAHLVMTNVGTGSAAYRTIACSAQCNSEEGWYVDLADSGERVNVDMQLVLGTLIVASNVPTTNACDVGGYSWINSFNYKTGLAIASSENNAVGRRASDSLIVGITVVKTGGGGPRTLCINSAGEVDDDCLADFDPIPPEGKAVGWREIMQ